MNSVFVTHLREHTHTHTHGFPLSGNAVISFHTVDL